MSKPLHPLALFRLGVLGPLTSRGDLKRGEVKTIIRDLASKNYLIPDSRRASLSVSTITRWYYDWLRDGIEALVPNTRSDKGRTQLPEDVQCAVLQLKKDNQSRSLNTIITMCKQQGIIAKDKLSRATLHRFLQQQKLSKRIIDDAYTIERRSFEAKYASDIWHGDVLHGPSIQTSAGFKKTYLVSLLDDSTRLITHSAFCLGETALDIEGVLKQAVLKRGLCHKLIIDNGPAYRSGTLQSICAILSIRLIYCRPYEPQGKGKLEKFHSTFRAQFLNEIDVSKMTGLGDINARLWAWLEQVYHCRPHDGLNGKTPIARWREDLVHIRPLGPMAGNIDDIFYHRHKRLVRKDATVSWGGKYYEVPHIHVGEKVKLVVDPHTQTALKIESESGDNLGPVILLDKIANINRKRYRPNKLQKPTVKSALNSVELALKEHNLLYGISNEEK
jgi:transposase InsO family protein